MLRSDEYAAIKADYDAIRALVHGATRQGWSKGSDDAVMS